MTTKQCAERFLVVGAVFQHAEGARTGRRGVAGQVGDVFVHLGQTVPGRIVPDQTGTELVREVRRMQPAIRPLFTSVHDAPHELSPELAAGGAVVLQKPFAPDVLREALRHRLFDLRCIVAATICERLTDEARSNAEPIQALSAAVFSSPDFHRRRHRARHGVQTRPSVNSRLSVHIGAA